jgi:hypothetical protein
MSSQHTINRTTIYLSIKEKKRLEAKASENGLSLSRFLVISGLNYVFPLITTVSGERQND